MKIDSRIVISFILLHVFFMIGYSQTAIDSSRIVRVLSYNIFHGETMKGDFDLDRIAQVIKSAEPDLVALQEVDFYTRRARKMDLATELGVRVGMAPLFGKAMSYDGGEYGEGVLSRYTFLSTKNHALPAREGREPRSALEANVILPSGDTVRFIGTHLDHTRDETDRINQAKELIRRFNRDGRPSILAGDLNARPRSAPMNILLEEWTRSFAKDDPTFPASNPRSKIDYILFRPADRWRVLETRVIDEQIASDHRPVLTIFELLPGK